MKSIMCLILVVLTWGESVESYWKLMKAGRYDEAAAIVETYMNEGKRVTEEEQTVGEKLLQKANVCMEMKQRTQQVVLVDSIKVIRDRMLNICGMVIGGSKVTMREDGGTEFVAIRGSKRLLSVKNSNGYDIYRQYGNGEKEKLSNIVNTDVNDNYPYEMSDGVTLYFASEGHGSIGGYDIFMTRYNSETFDYSTPRNIGMPFNTLGNEYLMMTDDMAGLGLWVTDWHQTNDTVMVYVFKLDGHEEKVEERRKSQPTATVVTTMDEETEQMRFFLNDRIVYMALDNFKKPEARDKYIEMKELEREMRLVELVLESKRMNFRTETSDEEREKLIADIMEDERYLIESRERLKKVVKEIRQLELKEYE